MLTDAQLKVNPNPEVPSWVGVLECNELGWIKFQLGWQVKKHVCKPNPLLIGLKNVFPNQSKVKGIQTLDY